MTLYVRNDTPSWRSQIIRWRKHPTASRLIKEKMTYVEVKAVWCVLRNNISYEEIISELRKPDGGELLFKRNIGPGVVEALRGLCEGQTILEYGYA